MAGNRDQGLENREQKDCGTGWRSRGGRPFHDETVEWMGHPQSVGWSRVRARLLFKNCAKLDSQSVRIEVKLGKDYA
jgi:hypothetical protein